MKILYGVQGTGNGHLSRARVMADALARQGVEVDYLFSGRATDQFFDMQAFGDYRVARGLTFVTCSGSISPGKTVLKNLNLGWWREINSLDLSGYDLVLNDFEPVSAWAARRQGVPSLGISHQAALKYPVPKVGDTWLNEKLLNYFAPVDIALGCHWHHFGFPILPPFVEVSPVQQEFPHHILVYLPFESPESIATLLAPHIDYSFKVYHAGIKPDALPPHIEWHGFDRDGFKAQLASCGGVIGNAGFELASEALTLGKKLLVKPVIGQFEQLSNVAALELLGAAETMMSLDPVTLERWLKQLSPQPINYPCVADKLVHWLLAGRWDNSAELCRDLWSAVELPDSWRSRRDAAAIAG
ncbi:glycosyltransferase [Shewanella corallii]|uniref:Glycosyltransferase n=1 Tax=Shewanella corallii TaxID=560080 RepID=A0ABT0N196_9GAMM|nr:MJ1255/VC2487 family glycosyltransferase [Shewanella corallii]MCL2912216.1 glycosyltransferase [Shewanella corallii]